MYSRTSIIRPLAGLKKNGLISKVVFWTRLLQGMIFHLGLGKSGLIGKVVSFLRWSLTKVLLYMPLVVLYLVVVSPTSPHICPFWPGCLLMPDLPWLSTNIIIMQILALLSGISSSTWSIQLLAVLYGINSKLSLDIFQAETDILRPRKHFKTIFWSILNIFFFC